MNPVYPVSGSVAVVTGGAQGIGAALGRALVEADAGALALFDINEPAVRDVAHSLDATAYPVDVCDEAALVGALADVEKKHGRIDILCSNAGVLLIDDPMTEPVAASNEAWRRALHVNVMAHVYAARAVLPGMLQRGRGTLLQTVSAAGLLSQIGSATYSVSKHAAIGFAESLAIAYADRGIAVSALCPQGVDTPMLADNDGERLAGMDGVLSAEAVAEAALAGLAEGRFLILPHPQVATYVQRKAADYDRWLAAMRKLRAGLLDERAP